MEEHFAYLLELRLKARGDPVSLALIDRALLLMARLQGADGSELDDLEMEVRGVADELALRFGSPRSAVLQ